MNTIYVVTSGYYSDYGINAVFDEEEKAQAYIDYQTKHRSYGDKYEIEEWELNEYSDPISRGLTCFRVIFRNKMQSEAEIEVYAAAAEEEYVDDNWKHYVKDGAQRYVTWVWAKDMGSAAKIANERRMRYIVEHEIGLDQAPIYP